MMSSVIITTQPRAKLPLGAALSIPDGGYARTGYAATSLRVRPAPATDFAGAGLRTVGRRLPSFRRLTPSRNGHANPGFARQIKPTTASPDSAAVRQTSTARLPSVELLIVPHNPLRSLHTGLRPQRLHGPRSPPTPKRTDARTNRHP